VARSKDKRYVTSAKSLPSVPFPVLNVTHQVMSMNSGPRSRMRSIRSYRFCRPWGVSAERGYEQDALIDVDGNMTARSAATPCTNMPRQAAIGIGAEDRRVESQMRWDRTHLRRPRREEFETPKRPPLPLRLCELVCDLHLARSVRVRVRVRVVAAYFLLLAHKKPPGWC
jgi:hypothetical protein